VKSASANKNERVTMIRVVKKTRSVTKTRSNKGAQLFLVGLSQYILRSGGEDTHFVLETDAQRYAMAHCGLVKPLPVEKL
jgi:hypothetical protein